MRNRTQESIPTPWTKKPNIKMGNFWDHLQGHMTNKQYIVKHGT